MKLIENVSVLDPETGEYHIIQREVEEPDPIPPTAEELRERFPPLSAPQFHALLRISGYTELLNGAIAQITDPVSKVVAEEYVQRSHTFHRTNPMVRQFQAVLGISDEELDALWQEAAKH